MKDLTKGNVTKQLLLFALPIILANVFQQVNLLVDRIIVGKFIGIQALAAVGACFPLIFLLISLFIGITMGTNVIISQNFGAKRFKDVKKAIDTMYIFMFFASIIITIIGFFFSKNIFELINIPKEVVPKATAFMRIYMLGIVTTFGFFGTSAILRGVGDSKTPMIFTIINTVLNLALELLFVVVFKWGITGAAMATVIAQAAVFIASVIYLNKYHSIFDLNFLKMKFDREIFNKSIKIGLPQGIQQVAVSLGMLALIGIVTRFGINTLAAYTVAGQLDSFAMMPAMNFAIALSTFVGQNIGANKLDRVKKGLIATIVATSIFSIAVSIVIYFFGDSMLAWFSQDPSVIRTGHQYLIIVSSFYILFSIMFAIGGVLRGAGDTLIPMFITITALWLIRVPCSYFLSLHFNEIGIWWGIPIGWAFGLTASFIYYLTGRWKKIAIVRHKPIVEIVPEELELIGER